MYTVGTNVDIMLLRTLCSCEIDIIGSCNIGVSVISQSHKCVVEASGGAVIFYDTHGIIDIPKQYSVGELVFVPQNAQFIASEGLLTLGADNKISSAIYFIIINCLLQLTVFSLGSIVWMYDIYVTLYFPKINS